MQAPLKITIKSDGNELEFTGKSGKTYFYQYTKSITKLGNKIEIREDHLEALLKVNSIMQEQKEEAPEVLQVHEIKWLPKQEQQEIKKVEKTKPKQSSLF